MCDHRPQREGQEAINIDVHVYYLQDDDTKPFEKVDHYVLDLKLTCNICGEPMHFLGPDVGFSFEQPTVAVDRTVIQLPFAGGRWTELPKQLRLPGPVKKTKQ